MNPFIEMVSDGLSSTENLNRLARELGGILASRKLQNAHLFQRALAANVDTHSTETLLVARLFNEVLHAFIRARQVTDAKKRLLQGVELVKQGETIADAAVEIDVTPELLRGACICLVDEHEASPPTDLSVEEQDAFLDWQMADETNHGPEVCGYLREIARLRKTVKQRESGRKVYFISGHLDLTQYEFDEHYAPRIQKALEEDAAFVVGDSAGADTRAQLYLARMLSDDMSPNSDTGQHLTNEQRHEIWSKRRTRVTIFHMFSSPCNNPMNLPTFGGFTSDEERTATMTNLSSDDIAWVRPGCENSEMAKNLQRRAKTILKSCCPEPKVLGGRCCNCGEWIEDLCVVTK